MLDENTYCEYFFPSPALASARGCANWDLLQIFFMQISANLHALCTLRVGWKRGGRGGGALHSPVYKDTHREKERIYVEVNRQVLWKRWNILVVNMMNCTPAAKCRLSQIEASPGQFSSLFPSLPVYLQSRHVQRLPRSFLCKAFRNRSYFQQVSPCRSLP